MKCNKSRRGQLCEKCNTGVMVVIVARVIQQIFCWWSYVRSAIQQIFCWWSCVKCNTADILLVVICVKCNTADILLVVICEKCNTADSSCGGRCSMCYLWHLPARQLVKKYTKKDELESK